MIWSFLFKFCRGGVSFKIKETPITHTAAAFPVYPWCADKGPVRGACQHLCSLSRHKPVFGPSTLRQIHCIFVYQVAMLSNRAY